MKKQQLKLFQRIFFLTGCGGILYPPNKEFDSLVTDFKLAKELAPTADDIFFGEYLIT